MSERLSEREDRRKLIVFLIEKFGGVDTEFEGIADWHLAEVKRIISPIAECYQELGETPYDEGKAPIMYAKIMETLKRAGGE